MKKFLIVLAVLFVVNLGCKKENVGGGGLCACSPMQGPELFLVIKNSTGEDLLNDKTSGAYSKDKIELFRKDADGKVIPIMFDIRPPFDYGDEKFAFNQLYTPAITFLQKGANESIYLKLGGDKQYELNVELNKGLYAVEKVFIDKQEAVKDTGNLAKFIPLFYLTE